MTEVVSGYPFAAGRIGASLPAGAAMSMTSPPSKRSRDGKRIPVVSGSAMDQYRDLGMREYLDCLAPEDDR
jgi:hypothetical protein